MGEIVIYTGDMIDIKSHIVNKIHPDNYPLM